MNSEERSNEEKYPHGSIGHTFPEAAALMEGLLAERNALESRLAAALARIAAVEAQAAEVHGHGADDERAEVERLRGIISRIVVLAASPTPTGPERCPECNHEPGCLCAETPTPHGCRTCLATPTEPTEETRQAFIEEMAGLPRGRRAEIFGPGGADPKETDQ